MDVKTARLHLEASYNLILDADIRNIAYNKGLKANLRKPMYFLGVLFLTLYTGLLLLVWICWDALGSSWLLVLPAALALTLLATLRYIAFFLDNYTKLCEAAGAFRSCGADGERFVEFYNKFEPAERDDKFSKLTQQFADLRNTSPHLTEHELMDAEDELCREHRITVDLRDEFVAAQVERALNPPEMEKPEIAALN